MAKVLDYSAGFPGAAAIKRAGYVGAVRYIGYPGRTKCATKAELADFTRNGLGMALVHENTAGDWRRGFGGGREDAARARAHANDIGFPAGRPIYMAVDQDVVTAAEFAQMLDYLRGAGAVLGAGLVGVYGEFDVMARAQAAGVARWFWQTRAWSGTPPRLFAGRHLYQHVGTEFVGGVACDENDVLSADWGQHTVTAQEDDMDAYTRVDWERVNKLGPNYFGHKVLGTWQHAKAARAQGSQILGQLKKLQGDVDEAEARILGAVAAVQAGDVDELADALFARLGPGLAAEVVDELGRRIENPNTEQEN